MAISDKELGEFIGETRQQARQAAESRKVLHDKIEEQGRAIQATLLAVHEIKKDQEALNKKFDAELPHITDYKNTKQRSLGAWKVSTIIASIIGVIGTGIVTGFNYIFQSFKG